MCTARIGGRGRGLGCDSGSGSAIAGVCVADPGMVSKEGIAMVDEEARMERGTGIGIAKGGCPYGVVMFVDSAL